MKHATAAVILSTALVACMASTTADLTLSPEAAGRLGVGNVTLGQHWASVLPEAEARFGVEPVCSARKIAKRNSRRAFLLETCRYAPLDERLEGTPISEVVYHFIDQSLLRIDVATAALDDAASAALIARLESRFGRAGPVGEAATNSPKRDAGELIALWRDGPDEIALRRPDAQRPARLFLHLQDSRAAAQAAALNAR